MSSVPKHLDLVREKGLHIEWDDGLSGLGVRVSPTGKRSFVFMYRFQGTSRMMTLGTYPRLTLADARYKASQAKEKVCKEIDPGLEQIEKRIAEGEAYTIKIWLMNIWRNTPAKTKIKKQPAPPGSVNIDGSRNHK